MSKNKILVIDDNFEMRDMLIDMLHLKKYDAVSLDSGIDITSKLENIQPDLIVCDIAMPEKNGFEVLEDVRNSKQFSDIPFVFLTASMIQSDEEKLINASANGYLMKPYDSFKLFDLIARLLNESQDT